MRYIIASKGYEAGTQGSYTDQKTYTELGFEMCVSYLYIKNMINTGQMNPDDVIVTKKDREFLYQQDHPNVINFDDYLKITPPPENVRDLVEDMMSGQEETWFKENFDVNNYAMREKDYKLIRSFKKSNIAVPTKPFACIAVRKRVHAGWRNMSDDYTKMVIDRVLKPLVLNVFVIGNDIDNLCDNRTFAANMQDFATLSESKNCVACLASASGIIFLPYFFGNAKTIHMLPMPGTYAELMHLINVGHPLYHGYNTRFAPSKYFVYDTARPDHMYDIITNIKTNL